MGAADSTRRGAELRARTTAVTILAAAQIGTSGVLAECSNDHTFVQPSKDFHRPT